VRITAFLDEAQTEVALFHILRDLGWQTALVLHQAELICSAPTPNSDCQK
jgi:hypothetical protein